MEDAEKLLYEFEGAAGVELSFLGVSGIKEDGELARAVLIDRFELFGEDIEGLNRKRRRWPREPIGGKRREASRVVFEAIAEVINVFRLVAKLDRVSLHDE